MLHYNKYLKNVIKRWDYPLKEISRQDSYEEEIIVGTWNLDLTLCLVMISYFRAFRENAVGFPAFDNEIKSQEDWFKIIDKIIYGFEYYVKYGKDFSNKVKNRKASREIRKSLRLIAKYYEAFWW